MDARNSGPGHGQLGEAAARTALLAELHTRVLHADLQALNRLAEELLPLLRRALRRRFPSATEDQASDAVGDAILEYAARPSRLDTSNRRLDRLLLHAARRNLMNLLEAERRRHIRETSYVEHVERTLGRQKPSSDGLHPDTLRRFLSVAADESERKALRCWLDGDRTTAALSAFLGLSDASVAEQCKGVKRFKDRIVKRLRRQFMKGERLRSNSPFRRGINR